MKGLRNIVIIVLILLFSYYLYTSLDKLLSDRVGIAIAREPKVYFDFPSIAICGHVQGQFRGKRWISHAYAYVMREEDNGTM